MRETDIYLNVHFKRGLEGLPLERVYKHLFDPELYLRAYGKIYRNAGAMTKGTTEETVDGMTLQKIHKIIALLKMEQYKWTPVRRTEIPKANGKMRPLGIPCWSDKLLQECLRSLLEPYYEPRFSNHSHGFRPERSCHSALREIQGRWTGTVWFIEGDIKGCFDNIDHEILLSIIGRDIHDERLLRLLKGLVSAGYLEDWRYHDTTSGTPQGGIISPLLSNIYLNELDRFYEDTLRPQYSRGEVRRRNPEWVRISHLKRAAWQASDRELYKRLRSEQRKVPAMAICDPDYRRLKYVRYADDFLLGFIGPENEAKEIRARIGEFLRDNLKLTLSAEKTLITHSGDGEARFLGYEIKTVREGSLIASDGRRATNGRIMLMMPLNVVDKYRARYSRGGRVVSRAELLNESEYTIIQRYQSVLRGLHNYYCMASNVSKRMSAIQWILQTSLLKTLASKLKRKLMQVKRMFKVPNQKPATYRKVVERPGKKPLVAEFGGLSLRRIPGGMGSDGFNYREEWHRPASNRAEVVQYLTHGVCAICGEKVQEMHHIRKLADIDRAGRRPKAWWERIMSARRRKTLPVCRGCHDDIHAGRYDGPPLKTC